MGNTKIAVIIGGHKEWESDWAAFKKIIGNRNYDIALVNDQIQYFNYEEPEYFFSLHKEKIDSWVSARKENGLSIRGKKIVVYNNKQCLNKYKFHMVCQDKNAKSGTSGFFALYMLLEYLGYDKVILVGIPINNDPNYFRDEDKWEKGLKHRGFWMKHHQKIKNRVRSMSGWTAKILGQPDKRWLDV